MLVADALAAGTEIVALYTEPDATVPDSGGPGSVGPGSVEPTLVEPGVLGRVLDTVTPRPVAAVARIATTSREALVQAAVDRQRPVVVMDRVADPGNAGTILRSAEAAGAAGVVVTGGTVDLWSPKVVRSSAGSVLRVPIAEIEHLAEMNGDDGALELIGTAAGRGDAHVSTPLAGAIGIVVGSEAHGLDPDALVDRWTHIEMDGPIESLNVAMAATVLLFEARRQRRA
ncbi:MAG TPA: RNA methyltransferase [Microthrixaceae bacterium]|nr:RNA methyltransferase [Microthrixaceae bacterium]